MDGGNRYENLSQDADLRDTVVSQANHITRLEVENQRLRTQLKRHTTALGGTTVLSSISGGAPSTPVATARLNDYTTVTGEQHSTEEFDDLRKKYEDLVANHQQLKTKYEEHKQYVNQATKKYKAAKATIKEWKRYIDIQKFNTQARVANAAPELHDLSHSKHIESHDENVTPRARPTQSSGLPVVLHGQEDCQGQCTDLPDKLPSGSQQAEGSTIPSGSQGFTRVVDLASSSQTTEGDAERPVDDSKPQGPSCQPSDDEPQVVSARSLKRKKPSTPVRASPSRRIKQEFSSQNTAIEVNSQDYSSPPKVRQTLVRTETSDLSTITHIARTPRKHLKPNDETQRARSEELLALKPPHDHDASLSDSGMQHRPWRKWETSPRTHRLARQNFDRELPAVRARNVADAKCDFHRNVLMPLSNNLPTSPHAQAPRSGQGKVERMAAIVSEDGATLNSHIPGYVHDAPPKTNKQQNRRLDDMLGPIVEESKPVLKPRQVVAVKKPASAPVTPPPAANPPPHHNRINRKHAPAEASPSPVKPEDEPLRLRSVNQLRLEDFKVNSKYMDSSFAFADSLRKRDQKRCAPGCTNTACCGTSFRDLAAMVGGNELFQSNDKTKNDAELLEDYLGPEWEANVGALSPEQREETLIKARAYALSNQHGKHRQAFERRSTPPGFWRTDFPSTQETLEDRARAHEMLRQKVEERYREAMRPGGRWKFRDE